MAASTMGSNSLKECLKKYESNHQEEEKKRKTKKKKVKPDGPGVLVVDENPVWQKPVKLEEEEEHDSADEEKPQVDEDIEVKRMKMLELIRARRAYNAIAEDGSGWVTLSPKRENSADPYSSMSPPCKRNVQNDTPSPEHEVKPLHYGGDETDLSPPCQQQRRHYSPSPAPDTNLNSYFSPHRKQRYRNDTPSPEPQLKPSREVSDLSSPRWKRKHDHSPSPEPDTKSKHCSGPNSDLSAPRRRMADTESSSPPPKLKPLREDTDLSPPTQQWQQHYSPSPKPESDLSPPRRSKKDAGRSGSPENSQSLQWRSTQSGNSCASMAQDISPPRRNRKESSVPASSKEHPKTDLITGCDIGKEILKTKKDASLMFDQMDPSISGQGAEPVYRDKKAGERISKDDYLKSKQKVEKPKACVMVQTRGGESSSRYRDIREDESSFCPGPNDFSVLRLQHKHRSEDIWARRGCPVKPRQHTLMNLDERVRPYIIQAGFYEISQLKGINIDHGLIAALVERWRQETHTFHFRVGEMTPTLQDVAMLLSLPIDGAPVTGSTSFMKDELCLRLLGQVPPHLL